MGKIRWEEFDDFICETTTGRIRWQHNLESSYGYVGADDRHKYFVGCDSSKSPIVADVRGADIFWRGLDIQVESIKHGIALCEAWEATGAY